MSEWLWWGVNVCGVEYMYVVVGCVSVCGGGVCVCAVVGFVGGICVVVVGGCECVCMCVCVWYVICGVAAAAVPQVFPEAWALLHFSY